MSLYIHYMGITHMHPTMLKSKAVMVMVLLVTTGHSRGCHHGPLNRYVKVRIAYAPGMPGTFSPPRASDSDMHHARVVMHTGIANNRLPLKSVVPSIPGACSTRNFSYLVREPWQSQMIGITRSYLTC